MKVLVVDDEYAKVEAIAAVAKEFDQFCDIRHVTTARDARLSLRRGEFDVIIVDLNLPPLAGASPSIDGGLDAVKMLMLDKDCSIPACLMFMTSHEECLKGLSSRALEIGGELYRFGADELDWRVALRGKIEYAKSISDRRINRFDVAILTALRSPELSAVLELPYEWKELKVPGDSTVYHSGRAVAGGRAISIVAASAMRKGMSSSASLASRMVVQFQPKLLVMPGICAGRKSKVGFGDVVVADPAWDWGSGKRAIDPDREPVFLMSPHQSALDPELAQIVNEICHSDDVLMRVRAGWAGTLPQGSLRAFVSPFASGASVIADGDTFDDIQRRQNRDVIALDMEAYAVMEAASYTAGDSRTKAIAMKSVCDFGDGEKGDEWQKYASFTSARFMHEFITSERISSYLEDL
ncbi:MULTISPECIES: hypothetical protein [Stenotrophomonas]|uniref:phosphorylase family protein n=1 Tax=Stenotrophomonas TaxID=40323 RepID=UPI000B760105|nr:MULTISPECIES: hypothetical protein [Stenotrophomonas]SMR82779.1 Nucleoside phosphorylase [Stenotrophomonas sp. yr243]SNT46883.1 response regulator receiver protein [Stenotrophomonas lactitubi]